MSKSTALSTRKFTREQFSGERVKTALEKHAAKDVCGQTYT